jgi:hypothetical protein
MRDSGPIIEKNGTEREALNLILIGPNIKTFN